jgi:hypothetical protein
MHAQYGVPCWLSEQLCAAVERERERRRRRTRMMMSTAGRPTTALAWAEGSRGGSPQERESPHVLAVCVLLLGVPGFPHTKSDLLAPCPQAKLQTLPRSRAYRV